MLSSARAMVCAIIFFFGKVFSFIQKNLGGGG